MSVSPPVTCYGVLPTICAPDVPAAFAYYRDKLGFKVDFLWGEPPTHAGLSLGEAQFHVSHGDAVTAGMWMYFSVENIDALYERYREESLDLLDEPEGKPWGMRQFTMRDLNGYHLHFGQWDPKSGERIPVERIALDARIEKRLAALLEDLAKHKNLTLSETLEEILLHTLERGPDGQGVASPHTELTMGVIEELKRKHGIDYETHDAYRFIEGGDRRSED